MPVIKASESAALIRDAIVLDLGDLARQAEQIRLAARDQARATLQAAEAEARRLIAAAHGQGFDAGRAEGRTRGLAEGREQGRQEALVEFAEQLRKLEAAWTAALTAYEVQRTELEREARTAVLELAMRLAARIVHRHVEADASVVLAQVGEALQHVLKPVNLVVRVHPEDRPALDAALPSLMARFPQLQQAQLAADESVGRGGCVLTHGQGRLDATLETQLRRMAELLVPGKG